MNKNKKRIAVVLLCALLLSLVGAPVIAQTDSESNWAYKWAFQLSNDTTLKVRIGTDEEYVERTVALSADQIGCTTLAVPSELLAKMNEGEHKVYISFDHFDFKRGVIPAGVANAEDYYAALQVSLNTNNKLAQRFGYLVGSEGDYGKATYDSDKLSAELSLAVGEIYTVIFECRPEITVDKTKAKCEFDASSGKFAFRIIAGYTADATANPTEGGSITGVGGYESDAEVTLTAIPNEGYHFVQWTEAGQPVTTTSGYTFNINADAVFTANFATHDYVWVIDKEATESEQGVKHEVCKVCGETRNENTVIAKLPSDDWYAGSGSGDDFDRDDYQVSTPNVNNGEVKVSDSYVAAGEDVTMTATPDNGYGVAEVIVTDEDGNIIPVTFIGNGRYIFVMPKGKVNIETICKPAITLTIGNPNVNVFGANVQNDVAPIIGEGNRTMLPIRVIAESLGADVDWDGGTQKVSVTKDGKTIELYIGKTVAYINGEPVQLDTAAFISNSRTYLPLRFISEALDAMVNWDAATKTVTVIPE